MALKTTDPTTGEDKYSPVWIVGIATVLFTVGFGFFYFMVLKPKQLKNAAPAVSIDRGRTEHALSHGEAPSVTDDRKKGQEFLTQVGNFADPNEVQTEAMTQGSGDNLSNTGGRFTTMMNSERLNRLGAEDDTVGEGNDDYVPSQYNYTPTPTKGSSGSNGGAGSIEPNGRGAYRVNGGGKVVETVPNISGNGPNGQALQSSNGTIQVLSWGGSEDAPSGVAAKLEADAMNQRFMAEQMANRGASMPVMGSNGSSDSKNHISVNSVPTGTQVSVVLMNNTLSSSLKQRVWAITTQELVFRRQVQLPKGVLLGGWQAGTPVREQLDVTFDIMVFPDGTELPITGFGVNAFSPMYPGLEGMRGLADRYVEPPGWTLFLPVLLDFVSGYTQDVLSGQVVVSDGTTSQARSPKEAMNKAVNTAVQGMHAKVLAYLERYTPYVHLRKGMPFKIEFESTVDFSQRTLGARSYEDTVAAVKAQNASTVQQVQQMPTNPPSAPEFLGMGNQNTAAADLRSQLQTALAASAALK